MTDAPTGVENEQDSATATEEMPGSPAEEGMAGDADESFGDAGDNPQIESALDDLEDFAADAQNLDLLLDVDLKITVELGRTRTKFRDVLNLSSGSIVELSKQMSEPVDVMINGQLLATGEVVVIDGQFAVRITKLLNRVERLKRVL